LAFDTLVYEFLWLQHALLASGTALCEDVGPFQSSKTKAAVAAFFLGRCLAMPWSSAIVLDSTRTAGSGGRSRMSGPQCSSASRLTCNEMGDLETGANAVYEIQFKVAAE
jgi:hypothetical protein